MLYSAQDAAEATVSSQRFTQNEVGSFLIKMLFVPRVLGARRGPRLVLAASLSLYHSFEIQSLSTCNSLFQQDSGVVSFRNPPVSTFQGVGLLACTRANILHGYSGCELGSSCLHSGHFTDWAIISSAAVCGVFFMEGFWDKASSWSSPSSCLLSAAGTSGTCHHTHAKYCFAEFSIWMFQRNFFCFVCVHKYTCICDYVYLYTHTFPERFFKLCFNPFRRM